MSRTRTRAGTAITLSCPDGREIQATHYGDQGPRIVLAGATAVAQRFYRHTATWLAAQGTQVLTFDYRGIAASRDRPLRVDPATMADWGRLDLEAALQWARAGEGPPRVLAHSVGGQLLGLAPSAEHLEAACLVGSQSGHWRTWEPRGRLLVLTLWFVAIPVLTRLTGRFPSAWFGMGEPLPKGVARQWAHWGRHRDYLWGRMPEARERAERMQARMHFVHAADDHRFAPRAAVEDIASRYAGAQVTMETLQPTEAAGGAIGHFGWFRPGMEPAWRLALDWLVPPARKP